MTTLDRSEINRALTKAIAYKQCGKNGDAMTWAAKLINLLECNEILTVDAKRAIEARYPA